MPSTRSPIVVLAALLVVAFVPLLVMWVVVAGVERLAYLAGFALYFVVFHVALPARVYLDATPLGREKALAWTAFAFVVPLLGAMLYFLLGRPPRAEAETV